MAKDTCDRGFKHLNTSLKLFISENFLVSESFLYPYLLSKSQGKKFLFLFESKDYQLENKSCIVYLI